MAGNQRADHVGAHRAQFESNRRKIFRSQNVCGICGRPVDFTIPYPEPLSACIDHIIPVNRGGHPSDIANLQLAHMACNRAKSDKVAAGAADQQETSIGNRLLPQHADWAAYRPENGG